MLFGPKSVPQESHELAISAVSSLVRGSLSCGQRFIATEGLTNKAPSQEIVPLRELSFAVCWRPVMFEITAGIRCSCADKRLASLQI
jgi:hypothetical protein